MLRETLQDVLAGEDEQGLRWWSRRATRSRLEPFRKLATTIRTHWDGVVEFLETRVTNGPIEAINGLLQLAKRMARGFRFFKHFSLISTHLKQRRGMKVGRSENKKLVPAQKNLTQASKSGAWASFVETIGRTPAVSGHAIESLSSCQFRLRSCSGE